MTIVFAMQLVSVLNILVWAVMGGVLAAWLVPPPGADADTKNAWQRYAIIIGAALAAAGIGFVVQKAGSWVAMASGPKIEEVTDAADLQIPIEGTAMEGATPPPPSDPLPTLQPEGKSD